MSTQSDSDGSKEEEEERFQGAGQLLGEGAVGDGAGQEAEQLGEEACRNSKEMSAKLAAKEMETLQVYCYIKKNIMIIVKKIRVGSHSLFFRANPHFLSAKERNSNLLLEKSELLTVALL